MKLIVGLGNPGEEYGKSRHNIGFMLIDLLARRWRIDTKKRSFQARTGGGHYNRVPVVLLKPQTYMNLSGWSVREAVAFYKIQPDDLMVILDDMALETGQIRLRAEGSAGGHNGLRSIIEELGRDDFPRLRIGIGQARPGDAVNHVLGPLDTQEQKILDASLEKAAHAVESWIDAGLMETMNRYNRKPTTE